MEIQTDGFDDMAYGVVDSIQDPTMGWGGGGLFLKTFTCAGGSGGGRPLMGAERRLRWSRRRGGAERVAVSTRTLFVLLSPTTGVTCRGGR